MKTLDEVIKAVEWCTELDQSGCSACPYADDDNRCYEDDALHYLKHLQEIEDEYEELKDWWAEEHAENVPLTMDELKTMEGKPVWVEKCQDDEPKGWLLILRSNHDVVTCTTKHGNSFYLYRSLYGEKWQAYRKERE